MTGSKSSGRTDGRAEAPSRDERYQQLVELAPDGILTHDGERITLANSAAVQLAGAARRDQVVGQPVGRFLDPPYLKAIEAGLVGGDGPLDPSSPVRDTLHRVDGSDVPVEVRTVVFIDGGRPSAHLVVRDITERLAMEQAASEMAERLQQAQKMEAVGALAGGVAHEVNNMMSVILGYGEFLLQDDLSAAERTADVREILRAADRAAAVTQQLLAYSRRAIRTPQVVDLGVAVGDLGPILRRLLGEARQLIIAAQTAGVEVDLGQLEQVMVNLALNARDAMPGGGTLTIRTESAEVPRGGRAAGGALIPPGRYATIVVQDTGHGMDAATVARIFEPFFTTKPVGQGTGLGLAAVHGILTQNQGYITVTSAPEQGTVFTVYLPQLTGAAPESDEDGPPRPVITGAGAGTTVLIVDDEPAVRAIAARSLQRSGVRVLQASDGVEALELVERTGPPDLVLTDLAMPNGGGAELARHLLERWPDLRIVFMSGYSADELRREGWVGLEGRLLRKPFTPAGLVTFVTEALTRPRSP